MVTLNDCPSYVRSSRRKTFAKLSSKLKTWGNGAVIGGEHFESTSKATAARPHESEPRVRARASRVRARASGVPRRLIALYVHDRMSAMPRYSCTFLVALLAAAAATVRATDGTWINGAGCKSCERCCPSLMPLGNSLTEPDFSCCPGADECVCGVSDRDWEGGECQFNACPERTLALADLPDELLDPAAMGEWIPYDEYNGFPLRDNTCTDDFCAKGTFVLWKDWYKGTVNALHQTAQTDAEWQKLVDAGQTGNRQEGHPRVVDGCEKPASLGLFTGLVDLRLPHRRRLRQR